MHPYLLISSACALFLCSPSACLQPRSFLLLCIQTLPLCIVVSLFSYGQPAQWSVESTKLSFLNRRVTQPSLTLLNSDTFVSIILKTKFNYLFHHIVKPECLSTNLKNYINSIRHDRKVNRIRYVIKLQFSKNLFYYILMSPLMVVTGQFQNSAGFLSGKGLLMLVPIPAVIRKPILFMSKPNNNEAGNNLTSKNLKEKNYSC